MKDKRTEYKSRYVTFIDCLTSPETPNSEDEIHAHHDGVEIYEFLEGDLYFAADGDRIQIERGDIVIITDGVLHRPMIRRACRYHRRRIQIKNEFFLSRAEGGIELKRRLAERRVIKLSAESAAHSEFAMLIERIKSSLSAGDEYSVFCAEVAMLSLIIRAIEEKPDETPTSRRGADSRVRSLIRYIDENIEKELCYRTVADMLHLSEKSLYKLFKRETGFTLSRYIRERRIIIAKYRMNAGASPSEAAESVGFCDYSTFYRAFIASVGVTPTEYISKLK